MAKEMTYEQAMKDLQKIMTDLEKDKVKVDDLPKKVKQANTLIQFCKTKLRDAEADVMSLMED